MHSLLNQYQSIIDVKGKCYLFGFLLDIGFLPCQGKHCTLYFAILFFITQHSTVNKKILILLRHVFWSLLCTNFNWPQYTTQLNINLQYLFAKDIFICPEKHLFSIIIYNSFCKSFPTIIILRQTYLTTLITYISPAC